MDAYVALIVGLLATPVAGVVTYWVSRPKTSVEIRKAQAEAESISVQTMTHLVQVLNAENDSLREELEIFRLTNKRLEATINELSQTNKRLETTIGELQVEVEALKRAIGRM